MTQPQRFWLFKSEPEHYSIDDLYKDKKAYWDGVRNYQARNFLRDEIKNGDLVFFYHSNATPLAIVGVMKVVQEAYTDHTAFDPDHPCHYDPKSDPEKPAWVMVDVQFVRKFKQPVTREMLKEDPVTCGMMVMAKGSRLSIQPVTHEQWQAVLQLADKIA